MTEVDTATLDSLVTRLERAAEQLRTGDLSSDAAAGLVGNRQESACGTVSSVSGSGTAAHASRPATVTAVQPYACIAHYLA